MAVRLGRLLFLLLLLAGCHDQAARGGVRAQITSVGSSTVYPFTTIVAENYVASDPAARTPVIESTGTGAGLKLFCAGIGAAHPDIADASRRITAAEYAACRRNGTGPIIEIEIGLDGLAFARSKAAAPFPLTVATLYRALAAAPGGATNRARTWHDVDPALPATPIRVYGPPATSGTRDALVHLVLLPGCRQVDPGKPEAACTRLREDGAFVDAGENDNLIVQKLVANPDAIGIFGYSYLEQNAGSVVGVPLDGVAASYDAIASGRYPGSRPLFLYVKQAHLAAVPGLRSFLKLYAGAWNPGGPLVRRGLIAAPASVRARSAAIVAGETPLDPATLS